MTTPEDLPGAAIPADATPMPVVLGSGEQYWRLFFEQSAMGILVGDADGRILDANPMALSLLGYDREQQCRRYLDRRFGREPAFAELAAGDYT